MIESEGIAAVGQAIGDLSLGGRAPLYQLLAVPFVFLLGPREDVALLVNVLFGAILLTTTFVIGRRVCDERAGLLAAFLVACYPPIVHLSRVFLPHFALVACVALSLWRLLVLLDTGSVRASWWFSASLVFGMWIHPSFAWVLATPTAVFGVYLWLFRTDPRHPASLQQLPGWAWRKLRIPVVSRGLVPGLLCVCALVLAWYLTAGARLLEAYRALEVTPIWAIRGFPGVPADLGWYARTAPGAISIVFTSLLVVGLVSCILRRNLQRRVMVISFIGAYILINLQPARAWWYFGAVLPIAAVVTAVFVFDIPHRRISAALAAVCLFVGAFNFATVSWGALPWSEPLARALGAPLGTPTCAAPANMVFCPHPPQERDWGATEIVRALRSDPVCRARACQLYLIQPTRYPRSVLDAAIEREGFEAPPSIHVYIKLKQFTLWHDYWLYVDYPPYPYGVARWPLWRDFIPKQQPFLQNNAREVLTLSLPTGGTARLIKIDRPPPRQGRTRSQPSS